MIEKSGNLFEVFKTTGSSSVEVASEQFAMHVENNVATPLFAALDAHTKNRAMDLARNLQMTKYEYVLSFGLPAQDALKQFTSQMLLHVQRKEVSKVGDVLFDLMQHLEKIDPDALVEQEKGFFSMMFSRQKKSIQEVMSHYKKLSNQIDRLGIQLSHTQTGLLSDYKFLDELYGLNEDYFHEINVYIAAVEIKKHHLLQDVLPKLQVQTLESDDPMQKHKLQDLHMQIEWLDKRMYDLEISREISIQCAPHIRLIQQTNQMLIEKIQSSVMTTIPLWQSQISMLLSMNSQRRAMQSQQRLMDVSDELMRKNGKMMDVTARATRKQKGVSHSDIDRFKQTQLQLLKEIEDTLRIQATSNEKRHQVETTILDMK
ncbi:toxic anion resistance protein [Solibacillus sp. FSL H8-0538]|uniref:toxic anion resistance protein n=1 Tax=Solibacillus sp. FSL H8-0538 TaxID=2921400 RepID=UPI0030FB1367